MSVTNVAEIWSGRVGSDDVEVANSGATTNLREYTRVFRVLTDNNHDTAYLVLNNIGIPSLGTGFENAGGTQTDVQSVVVKRRAEPDQDEPRVWVVRVDYSTDATPHPIGEPVEAEWGVEEYEKPFTREINNLTGVFDGTFIRNSAGDPFDPPITIEDGRLTLIIHRNEEAFPKTLAAKYKDAVNADVFQNFPAGQWKMKPITGRKDFRKFQNQNVPFWRVTYRFHHRHEGWRIKPLDQGMWQLVSGKLVRILDPSNGVPVSAPVALNGAGVKLAANADPVYLPINGLGFQAYRELNFADLQLPLV